MTEKSANATIGRRHFLYGSAMLYGMTMTPAMAAGKKTYAYVGTYTDHGKGIQTFEIDAATGALTPVAATSWCPTHRRWLSRPIKGFSMPSMRSTILTAKRAARSAPSRSPPATGALTLLNVVTSEGATPTFISVDPLGKFCFLPPIITAAATSSCRSSRMEKLGRGVRSAGHLPVRSVPTQAADGPPGNLNNAGHDTPHAHMISPDPTGKFLIGADNRDRSSLRLSSRPHGGKTGPERPRFRSDVGRCRTAGILPSIPTAVSSTRSMKKPRPSTS